MGEAAAIRPARPADRVALRALWLDLVAYHRRLDPDYPVPEGIDGLIGQEIERGLDDAGCRIAVAENDASELVGFTFAEGPGAEGAGGEESAGADDVGWIHELWVAPAARRQGVGDALIAAARRFLADIGAGRLAVRVEAANAEGLRFWARRGLRERARVFEGEL